MKLITAMVKLDKLDDVVRAVSAAGARGMTATEVRGFGQQFGHHGPDRPEDAVVLVLPKLRIDVLTVDELAWPVAESIAKAVNTGAIGDGKIWISPVEDALRVRTGERGLAAV
ncbi:MAG TPA: P-II family nitrogen regulator [Streptosporangiaceae bacterium]|nr:P-II family nitrogen regulator [Streptosporangiaceae bacterium]